MVCSFSVFHSAACYTCATELGEHVMPAHLALYWRSHAAVDYLQCFIVSSLPNTPNPLEIPLFSYLQAWLILCIPAVPSTFVIMLRAFIYTLFPDWLFNDCWDFLVSPARWGFFPFFCLFYNFLRAVVCCSACALMFRVYAQLWLLL